MSADESNKSSRSRREFFKLAGSASLVAGGLLAAGEARAEKLPTPKANLKKFTGGGKFPKSKVVGKGRVVGSNDRVLMGIIGLGGMGTSHLNDFVKKEKSYNTQIIGLCDPYRVRLDRGRNIVVEGSKGCGDSVADKDYRKILDNKDIDAVIIASPEHWHSEIAVHALEAGKHVYVEKPMARYLDEAWQIYDAKQRTGKIVQVGAQGTSEPQYHKAREIVNEGKLGTLVSVQTSYCRNSKDGEWNYKIDPEAGPDNLDWELWLGSAAKRPWNDDSKDRFFRYRKYRDYSAGILGDLMPHKIYPTLVGTGKLEFPKRVSCIGTRMVSTDREVSDTVHVTADYPSGWTFLFIGSTVNEQGLKEMMRGNRATLYVGSDLELSPERPYAEEIDGGPIKLPDPGERHPLHRKDFVDSIRASREPNGNIEIAMRGQVLISLAEISEITGKTVEYDEKRRTWKAL